MNEQHDRRMGDIGFGAIQVNWYRDFPGCFVNACLRDVERRRVRRYAEGFHLWKLYAIAQG